MENVLRTNQRGNCKPPKTSHAKFAKYAKFCFMDDFANLADFA